jgi:hypothetical protein
LFKRKHGRGIAGIIALIPLFSSLAFFGASGIACAALFFALFAMLKEPVDDFKLRISSLENKSMNKEMFLKEIILPYKFYWFLLPLFAAAFFIIIIFSQLKLLFLIFVFAAAAAVFFFSMKIMSLYQKDRRRFVPLLIIKRRHPEFHFPVFMLPFTAAAFFTLFSAPYMSASYDYENRFDIAFDNIIYEQDYIDHLNHQSFFSTRRLDVHSSSNLSYGSFPSFFFDTDGLPVMEIAPIVNQVNINDFPPFPLKDLMDFFHDVNSRQWIDTGGGAAGTSQIFSLLVLLLFILPLFLNKKQKDHSSKSKLDNLLKAAARDLFKFGAAGNSGKMRLMGINWNKKSLYNERNQLRVQKDA